MTSGVNMSSWTTVLISSLLDAFSKALTRFAALGTLSRNAGEGGPSADRLVGEGQFSPYSPMAPPAMTWCLVSADSPSMRSKIIFGAPGKKPSGCG
jgi:hypothetical protein